MTTFSEGGKPPVQFAARMVRGVRDAVREFRSSLENPQVPLNFPAEWML